MQQQMHKGSISRACLRLRDVPILRYQEASPIVEGLFAEAPAPVLLDTSECPPMPMSRDFVRGVVRSLDPTKAGGPSGMTVPHVRAAINNSEDTAEEFAKLIELIASGKLPPVPELLDSRLIPLQKGDSARPLSIGETIFRVAQQCALSMRPNAGTQLAPHQLGVGVKAGSQAVGQSVLAALEKDPDLVVVDSDAKNAFGSIDRGAVFAATKEREPAWLPLTQWMYGQPNRMWFDDAPPDAPPVWAHIGVQQGFPMGPSHHAFGAQATLERAAERHPDAPVLAFLDDCYTLGHADKCIQAVPEFWADCATIGLQDVPHKGMVYSRNAEAAARVAAALGYQDCSQSGIRVVGTPVGKDAWVRQECARDGASACELVDMVMELPGLPKQQQLLLLRKSVQQKLRHLPRTVAWQHVAVATKSVEDKVQDAVLGIMGVAADQVSEAAQLQMSLPMRHGGLDLPKQTPAKALAAYLACAAQSDAALQDAPQLLRIFEGVRGAQLEQQWGELVRAVDGVPDSDDFKEQSACLWKEAERAPTQQVIRDVMPRAQREVSRRHADAERERLMAMHDTEDPFSTAGAQAAARIRSCSGGAASAFLEALPTTHDLRIANSAMAWELRLRLGIQIMPLNNAGRRCACGAALRGAQDADHALVCDKQSGVRTLRHDNLNKVWCGVARCAGVASAVEPKLRMLQMQPGVRRHEEAREDARGDALLAMSDGMLVIDVNVVHAPAQKYVEGTVLRGSSSAVDGAAAAMAEDNKASEYRHDVDGGAYAWEPVVMESCGRLGKGAMRVLNRLALVAAESDGVEKHVFVQRAQQVLSVARVRGNALIWKGGLHAMAHGGGRCFQAGLARPTDDVG